MIVVRLMGGLGNQMFQYAIGRACSLKHGVPLYLDLSWFTEDQSMGTPRKFGLDVFPFTCETALPELCMALTWQTESWWRRLLHKHKRHAPSFIQEPCFSYWSGLEKINPPYLLEGYWQNEQYFLSYKQQICQDYTFPSFTAPDALRMEKRILRQEHSVSVHIRRGDYYQNSQMAAVHAVNLEMYYAHALQHIQTKVSCPQLFLFSDEPEWVETHFDSQGLPYTIVNLHGEEDSYQDMHLMSLCRHHVLANSSFSWWGTWLAEKPGIVCAPSMWFASPHRAKDNPSAQGWLLVD